MKNKCIVLMPASQYRIKKLYEHVNSIEGTDGIVFTDAKIKGNLSVAECYKEILNKYTYQDIMIACSDKEYYEYYKWNIEHNRNLVIKRIDNAFPKPPEYLSVELDFIGTPRAGRHGGSLFGKGSYGYKWNITKTDLDNGWIHMALCIHFDTKLSKDNFAKWWYSGKKGESLASKALIGTPFSTYTISSSYAIPQLDWGRISDNELWKAGKYDEAVLNVMGLKWEGDYLHKVYE